MTESQKTSAYFAVDTGYDKKVYENDINNWFKIIGMLMLFYIFNGLHWWANFELAIADGEASTFYNLLIFGITLIIITSMVCAGSYVNKKKIIHEFWIEKISEEK